VSRLDPGSGGDSDRRFADRRFGGRIGDLTLPELRRIVLTAVLFLTVLGLFLWMVRGVIIAALLGLIIAFYLGPLDRWLTDRLHGRRRLSALLTLIALIVPLVAVVLYSYFEALRVGDYLVRNQAEVTREVTEAVHRLPWMVEDPEERAEEVREDPEDALEQGGRGPGRVDQAIRDGIARAARVADDVPGTVGRSAGRFAINATIFLFTAFYILTRGEILGAYLRGQIPDRYSELVRALDTNVRGVLYGAIYSTLVAQVIKSAVLFALFLIFGVPLAAVLAVLSFVIGFFPIVGSWTVYLPVAVWLLVFAEKPFAAVVVLAVGGVVNTLFISTYLRPKLAADKSHVLDFYWMLLGLVTGVYTFGLAGVVLGPILIGLLKAILDTVTNRASWRLVEQEYEE
jgi:predicted PurR-regulated permease PerM